MFNHDLRNPSSLKPLNSCRWYASWTILCEWFLIHPWKSQDTSLVYGYHLLFSTIRQFHYKGTLNGRAIYQIEMSYMMWIGQSHWALDWFGTNQSKGSAFLPWFLDVWPWRIMVCHCSNLWHQGKCTHSIKSYQILIIEYLDPCFPWAISALLCNTVRL